ncbi:MAG: sugar phosphate isomerase/epimerase [Verrucomicrobia bacterium]|nr:sugar phosphate isomerase/epimerase [Verrucomicrobiota bacterium]
MSPAIQTRASATNTLPRRSALKLLGAALALPALAPLSHAVDGKPLWKTAVGLNGFQSGTRKYGRNYPIWEVLDFASRNHFDGVELVGDWPSGGYPGPDAKERVQALRGLYDRYGLRIFSIQLGADGAFDPEEPARQRWLQEFRERIRLAKQLGCECVGMWPGGGLRGQTIDQAIDRLAKTFREAGRIAGDAGILACFEIEPVFVFNKEDHYMRILHGADHPSLKGIYDPSHFDQMNGATGKPEEMLQRVGPANIGYLQFCDSDSTLRDGGTSKHLACGDGRIDCAKSLQILKAGGFRGWIMADEWEVPDPYDACLKCKRLCDSVGRA